MAIKFCTLPPMRYLASWTDASTFAAERFPGTTLTTNRCSVSNATSSQLSPCRVSAGLFGSHYFSFLPTNDHISPNCSSRIRGGKTHAVIVELMRVVACQITLA